MVDDAGTPTTWMTLKQGAAHLTCSPSYLARQVRSGAVRGYKLGKLWKFAITDLEEFVRRSRAPLPIPFVPRSRETER